MTPEQLPSAVALEAGVGGRHAWPLAWGVLLLWLACLLPNLQRNHLQDVDELSYARVAKSAAVDGQWWPLIQRGQPFFEKPPLLVWLAAATAKLSGQPNAEWPYRVWTALGAGLALASLAWLVAKAGGKAVGALAALLLALQGDFLFHARFFSFDAPFLGCALASLALAYRAAEDPRRRAWAWAGAALAAAVCFKSWFVLGVAPAYAFAVIWALPPGQRHRAWSGLGLPVLAALGAYVALYTAWSGWSFLAQEWGFNLLGRALGHSNEVDPQGHAAFYLKWGQRSVPALLPLVLSLPLWLLPQRGEQGGRGFVRAWTWAFCVSWLVGLTGVRAETINYLLALEAGLCLALGLVWSEARAQRRQGRLAALLLLAALAQLRLWGPGTSLALGLGLGLLGLAWRDGPGVTGGHASAPPRVQMRSWAPALAAAGLLFALSREAWPLLRRPLDPSREVAEILLAHPARYPGETLLVIGPPTQAPEFYASQRVQRLQALPVKRPLQAALVHTQQGWVYYPAQSAVPTE